MTLTYTSDRSQTTARPSLFRVYNTSNQQPCMPPSRLRPCSDAFDWSHIHLLASIAFVQSSSFFPLCGLCSPASSVSSSISS
ncbi:unnamed protein product, partial [Citrullus colocynthis]